MSIALRTLFAATSLALALNWVPALADDAQKKAPPSAPENAAPKKAAGDQSTASKDGGWDAAVATTPDSALDPKSAELAKKVSAYFNTLADLKGAFLQTNADGKKMKGKFLMKRPGRFRFDYALPSKQVIISDGTNLAIQDLDLNNEDRVALDQTPFRLLLRKDVDISRDAKIIEAQDTEDMIVLALEDKSPDTPGRIKLFFSTKPELELKEWVTTDPQSLDTRVEVSNLTKGEEIDAKMFKIEAVSFNNFHPQ